jgi:hypothetical protein
MGVESREALDVKITYTVAEDRRPGGLVVRFDPWARSSVQAAQAAF